jgi:hypothetical protein
MEMSDNDQADGPPGPSQDAASSTRTALPTRPMSLKPMRDANPPEADTSLLHEPRNTYRNPGSASPVSRDSPMPDAPSSQAASPLSSTASTAPKLSPPPGGAQPPGGQICR